MKVLVVDDVQMARTNMRTVLERYGIKVIEASDSKNALKLFKEENPDVVCLDLCLPNETDGLDTLKQIREINDGANVVIVSGMSNQYNFIESFKLGAKYFLVKPIDLNKFIQIVKSFDN